MDRRDFLKTSAAIATIPLITKLDFVGPLTDEFQSIYEKIRENTENYIDSMDGVYPDGTKLYFNKRDCYNILLYLQRFSKIKTMAMRSPFQIIDVNGVDMAVTCVTHKHSYNELKSEIYRFYINVKQYGDAYIGIYTYFNNYIRYSRAY